MKLEIFHSNIDFPDNSDFLILRNGKMVPNKAKESQDKDREHVRVVLLTNTSQITEDQFRFLQALMSDNDIKIIINHAQKGPLS